MGDLQMRSMPNGMILQEAEEVLGGGSVAVDGPDRRPQNLFMVTKPPLPQGRDSDGLKAQCCWGADLELGVDLGGELPYRFFVAADTRPTSFTVFVVAEVPNFAAEIALDIADAKGQGFGSH